MSAPPGKIDGMEFAAWVLTAAALGALLGALVVRLVLRAQGTASGAADAAAISAGRADVAEARREASEARAEAAAARETLARADTDVQRARAEVAEARSAAASAAAEAAEVTAMLTGALAERDAAKQRAAELAADRESLVNQFRTLSTDALERQGKLADSTAEQRLQATELLLQPVKEVLENFRERLVEAEKQRAVLAAELNHQVRSVQATGEQLQRETRALVTALRKPQVRGNWGEQQLKRVVELAGMVEHCDFYTQQTTTTSADQRIRPDLKVQLKGDRFVWVDSKVPLSAFLDAHETDDDTERERCLALFAKNVRTHVDQLSGKQYFKSDLGSPEFVVMFIPSEALAAEAYRRMPDLHEYAARNDIVLATPTTLIGLLRAVAYGWKHAALADSAAQVFELARELYDRLGTMGGHLDRLGRQLTGSVSAYNSAVGSLKSRVFATARRLRDLHVTDRELTQLTSSEAAVRPLTAPELVEDAVQVTPMIGARDADEAAQLTRPQPELGELLAPEAAPASHRRRTAG